MKMPKNNIGIVTTWFDRGASYVSKQYYDILKDNFDVYIFARGGEFYAKGDDYWDKKNVYWSKRILSPFGVTLINKKEFTWWLKKYEIDVVLFNEQHWWLPLLWCKELNVKTIAYVDYYTEETIGLFSMYDCLFCNTKTHFQNFKWHKNVHYIKWGINLEIFDNLNTNIVDSSSVQFFHSCGFNPNRKGTDLLIQSLKYVKIDNFKITIHTQVDLIKFFPYLKDEIEYLIQSNRLEIINKTIKAPGIYNNYDFYIYPSRLDGLGLTMYEAIASGLPLIIPDYPPMNEIDNSDFIFKLAISKLYSRKDGYYLPQNEIDIVDLANKITLLSGYNSKKIQDIKLQTKNYALSNLDWKKNEKIIETYIFDLLNTSFIYCDPLIMEKISRFENTGLKKLNILFSKYPIFSTLFKMFK
jgi:glycosyltransferase involved in cell wall biosynthesis